MTEAGHAELAAHQNVGSNMFLTRQWAETESSKVLNTVIANGV